MRLTKWIARIFSKNEVSSREALVGYFMRVEKMTREQAENWIDRRLSYLKKI